MEMQNCGTKGTWMKFRTEMRIITETVVKLMDRNQSLIVGKTVRTITKDIFTNVKKNRI